MDVSSLNLALPADGTVPEWVHLVPSGTFKGVDGRGPYTLKDPAAVIAASMTHGKLSFDENHSTQAAAIVGGAAPARGWIDRLEARPDGIWGHVEWTEAGKALMTDKAYRWVSPVFDYHRKTGEVLAIKTAALTNNPNLIDSLQAMHSALGASTAAMTEIEREDARRRILARARELGADTSGWSAHTEGQMEKSFICTALGLAQTVDDAAVLTALQNARETAAALQTAQARIKELETTHVPLDRVTALQTRLDTMEGEAKRAAAVAFVDGAIKAGKPLTAARDVWVARHVAEAAETERLINTLPSINAITGVTRTAAHAAGDGADDMLSAEDMAVCAKMGLDTKKFAENRKKTGMGTVDGRAA